MKKPAKTLVAALLLSLAALTAGASTAEAFWGWPPPYASNPMLSQRWLRATELGRPWWADPVLRNYVYGSGIYQKQG